VSAPLWANRPLVVAWSASAALLVGADVGLGPTRVLLVLGFLGLVPGCVACRRLLPALFDHGAVALLVAIATSIATTAAMAELLVLLRAWAPERAVIGLAIMAIVHLPPPGRRRPDGAADAVIDRRRAAAVGEVDCDRVANVARSSYHR
jgi:hypothetical protein